MILQEGRYYRSRDGRAYGPISRHERRLFYPFFFDKHSWTDGGKASIGLDTSDDLIAEITAHEAIPHVPPSDATPNVDRVVLASKILPSLAPSMLPTEAVKRALQYADAFLKEIDHENP